MLAFAQRPDHILSPLTAAAAAAAGKLVVVRYYLSSCFSLPFVTFLSLLGAYELGSRPACYCERVTINYRKICFAF